MTYEIVGRLGPRPEHKHDTAGLMTAHEAAREQDRRFSFAGRKKRIIRSAKRRTRR